MSGNIGSPFMKRLLKYMAIALGSAVYAAGFQFFMYPNAIVSGGVVGIAMIINYFTAFPVGVMTIVFNIPLFIIAWALLRAGVSYRLPCGNGGVLRFCGYFCCHRYRAYPGSHGWPALSAE